MKNTFTDLLFIRPQFTRYHTRALIMRISQVYLLILTSAIITMASPNGNGQSIETTTVNLEITNRPLKQVFKEIEKQTDFLFQWDAEVEKRFSKLSLPGGKYTVKGALDRLLNGEGLSYEQDKNYIIILPFDEKGNSPKETPDKKNDQPETDAQALVTGTVKDASSQEPIAGVNIIVKGTTKGSTTDVEGRFAIDAENDDVLVFTFIGFKSFETQVSGRIVIDVAMEQDVAALKEVVINAGYWQVKEKEKTGNISKIAGQEIERQPVSNPLSALQGRVPGLNIIQDTGMPGGNFQVRIRGQNSIASGNNPLYLIDGVPYLSGSTGINETTGLLFQTGLSPLNSINPADIESIEILKDADATAIYGSRGANGVILITTRKGKAGATKVDVSFSTGGGKVTRMIDLLTTEQYIQMRKESFASDGLTPDQYNAPDLVLWDTTRYTNWQEKLIGGTAQITNAQISVSGGSSNIQYVIGAGYRKESSVFPGDGDDQRMSTHFALNNSSFNDKFKLSLSVNYALNSTDLLNRDITSIIRFLPPNAPEVFGESGELNWENNTWINPFSYLKSNYNSEVNNLIANVVLSYNLLPGLEMKSNFGYSKREGKTISTIPLSSQFPPSRTFLRDESIFSREGLQSWLIEPQLNWNSNIGVGKLSVLLGVTWQSQETEGLALDALGFTNEALMKNIRAASEVRVGTDYYTQYRYTAAFGRINYNWSDKYIINITARRDGSSRFGPDKQFTNFGAVGIAWIFSNELFLQNLQFLSFGKLRGSYGITGNDQIGDYQFLDTYTSGYIYQNVVGLDPTRLYNPDFAWEINKKMEIALEFGLIDDRISFSISYYRNRSSNQLLALSLPPTTGFASVLFNRDAYVQNSGVELELNTVNLRSSAFTWTTSANITIPRNKLIDYPGLDLSPDRDNLVIGEPLNIVKVLKYSHVDSETGVYQFEDVNNDGSITLEEDRQTIRHLGQNYFLGFRNSIQYKGMQLSMLFQVVKQNSMNYLQVWPAPPGFEMINQPSLVMDRWRQVNDETDIQRFGQDLSLFRSYRNARLSDLSISDASFIRLKNVSLSYDLPKKWIQKLPIKVKIFIEGQNLLTITKFKGSDPESRLSAIPPLRILTAGFNLTF